MNNQTMTAAVAWGWTDEPMPAAVRKQHHGQGKRPARHPLPQGRLALGRLPRRDDVLLYGEHSRHVRDTDVVSRVLAALADFFALAADPQADVASLIFVNLRPAEAARQLGQRPLRRAACLPAEALRLFCRAASDSFDRRACGWAMLTFTRTAT